MKVSQIVNKNISVLDFKVKPSKHNDGDCLHLQISIGDIKYVVFTDAGPLIEAIKQVNKTDLPFETTIIEQDDRYLFT